VKNCLNNIYFHQKQVPVFSLKIDNVLSIFLLLLIATRLAEKKKIPEYLEKTTNLLQVTDQFYYMYGVNRAGFKLTTAPYGIIKQGRTF
jgi:hypothetical protein